MGLFTMVVDMVAQNTPETFKGRVLMLISVYAVWYTTYWSAQIIYRLTFHPLAKYPGPFLCRIGYFYQMYYEAILNGKMLERFPMLHEKYGPVVRINPHEVHIKDPIVFHEINKQNTRFTKDPVAYTLGVPNAISMLMDPVVHRQRREILNPSFSKRRINFLEDVMYEEIEKVFAKVTEFAEQGKVIPIQEAYYCYTGDIISRVIFGKSLDLIELPNFAIERVEQLRAFTRGIWISIHFGIIRTIIASMPRKLAELINDAWAQVIWFCEELAAEAIQKYNRSKGFPKSLRDETIFDRLLDANETSAETGKKGHQFGFQELADEGVALLIAGTETTATMTAYATYFFLHFPEVQPKIMAELSTIEKDENGRLPIVKIEAQPYFTGFVRETLRYAHGIPGRLTRVVPEGGLYVPSIDDTIPAGYVVGMSHMLIHNDPEIFEDPMSFKPERWLGEKGKELDHWLLSFSKGTRDCLGKTLAYTEMHLILANLFTRFELELCPGSDEGMVMMDRAIVHPTRNLRIMAKPKASAN